MMNKIIVAFYKKKNYYYYYYYYYYFVSRENTFRSDTGYTKELSTI